MSEVKMLFRSSTSFSFVDYNHFFLWGWFHSLLTALLVTYPNGPSISNTMGSPRKCKLQLHEMFCLGLHSRTPLTHAWPPQLSLDVEEDSIALFFCP